MRKRVGAGILTGVLVGMVACASGPPPGRTTDASRPIGQPAAGTAPPPTSIASSPAVSLLRGLSDAEICVLAPAQPWSSVPPPKRTPTAERKARAQARFAEAFAAAQGERLRQAALLFNLGLQDDYENSEAAFLLGETLLQLRSYGLAGRQFARVAELLPGSPRAREAETLRLGAQAELKALGSEGPRIPPRAPPELQKAEGEGACFAAPTRDCLLAHAERLALSLPKLHERLNGLAAVASGYVAVGDEPRLRAVLKRQIREIEAETFTDPDDAAETTRSWLSSIAAALANDLGDPAAGELRTRAERAAREAHSTGGAVSIERRAGRLLQLELSLRWGKRHAEADAVLIEVRREALKLPSGEERARVERDLAEREVQAGRCAAGMALIHAMSPSRARSALQSLAGSAWWHSRELALALFRRAMVSAPSGWEKNMVVSSMARRFKAEAEALARQIPGEDRASALSSILDSWAMDHVEGGFESDLPQAHRLLEVLRSFDSTGTYYRSGLETIAGAQAYAGDVRGALSTAARIDHKATDLTTRDDVLGGVALSFIRGRVQAFERGEIDSDTLRRAVSETDALVAGTSDVAKLRLKSRWLFSYLGEAKATALYQVGERNSALALVVSDVSADQRPPLLVKFARNPGTP